MRVGKNALDGAHNAVVIEELAFMTWHCQAINPDIVPMQNAFLDKHYLRKHGKDAYYGQRAFQKNRCTTMQPDI